uniref:Phospholipid transfer protein n=1 Tax=Cyprinus carpio carpio TaxID=630221 RepID=A0A9J7YQJ2_CYPCA
MGLLQVSVIFLLSLTTMTLAEPPGCKIRITDRGLEMLKTETKRFVEEELSNITMPEMRGEEGRFQYTIKEYVYFIYSFLTTGMRFLLNKQICPALNHAALVLVNQLLETIPVRTEVDSYVGIDYSLLSDPVVTETSLDMDFRGMFYNLKNENEVLVNYAMNPIVREYDRMIYLALSEFFFDSGLFSYFKGGLQKQLLLDSFQMPKDLEMLLRTTYLGTIMMLNPALMEHPLSLELEVTSPPRSTIKTSGANVAVSCNVKVLVLPPGKPAVQLSSMTMEGKFNAKVSMKGKRLAIHLDLRRFKIYSNQSALESLALIPLQGPLKTMLQISVVPLINNYIKRGVQIPLPDGIDFIEEVVEYHNGYIIVGANLHFRTGLREIIERKLSADPPQTNTELHSDMTLFYYQTPTQLISALI